MRLQGSPKKRAASSTLSRVQVENPEHANLDAGLIVDKRSRTVKPDAPSSASTLCLSATPSRVSSVISSVAHASAPSVATNSSSSESSRASIMRRLPPFFANCHVIGTPGPTAVPLCLPVAQVAGGTRSARIMSAATGFPTQSMKFPNDDDEFYLFMDLRAQHGWVSPKMTSVSWVEATSIFNAALEKKKPGAFRKTPRALMEKLATVEKQIINRKKNNNYMCERSPACLPRANHRLTLVFN